MRSLQQPGRSTVHSTNAMAATSHPLATASAITTLQAGGNAIDAAIVASAVLCVVEPQSTGIGGDCFCLYVPEGKGEVIALNGSGRAPAAATPEWYSNQGITEIEKQSPHAVTVPGAVDAWSKLLADHGTISLSDALQPAIKYAREGYPVSHRVHTDWSYELDMLRNDPASAAAFLTNGEIPAYGSLHKQPDHARTLEYIAKHGGDGFYRGEIAEKVVSYLQSLGGLHTLEDFANTEAQYVTPVKTRYKDHDIYECPPNGQGIVALEILNILSGYDLRSMEPGSAERQHLLIEASRLAYGHRDAVLADPDFTPEALDQWLSESHAAEQRAQINLTKATNNPLPSELAPHQDTIYLSIVDKDRNAVSFINSVFSSFGSAQMAPGTGFCLQNRGMGFVLENGHPNCIGPNKRPMHTIIPGMVMKDGRAVLPFGVMGGQYQATGHAQFITNLLDYDMDLQEAIDFPRLFPEPGEEVNMEEGFAPEVRNQLEDMGHETSVADSPIGGAQAIRIDWENGTLRGASDPRKDGCAIGY